MSTGGKDIVERLRTLTHDLLNVENVIKGRVRSDELAEAMFEAAEVIEQLRAKLIPRAQSFLDEERTRKIVAMRADGMTLDAIGYKFFLSKERVRQIIAKAERIARGEFRPEDYVRP